MNETITLPAPVINLTPPPRNKWEREYRAFQRLLPELLKTERGKYVAIHEERVIDIGEEPLTLALRVLAKVGNVDIHVGHVTEVPPTISRSGVRRVVRTEGVCS